MRKLFSYLFFIFIAHVAAFGQQDPQFTNNMFYKLGVNPGFAGSNDAISGIILNRYQWDGFKGAPKTLLFSADAAIELFGAPSGVGLTVVNDQLGFEENVQVNVSYAYKARLSFGVLGIGASGGFFSKSIDGEWYVPGGESSEYVNAGSDPAVPQGASSQIAFDAGLGLYLKGLRYYIGASVTHVNQAAIKYADLASVNMIRHYYLTGGYNIKLSDPLFEVRPSLMVKSDLASLQVDLNTNLVYNDRMWAGVTYRLQDAVALLMGIELLNGIQAGYSFDLTLSPIRRYGYGSHEIFLGYSLDLERNRNRKYKSVRFL